MRTLRAWYLRFTGMFHKDRRDRELAAEMESHLQMHIDDNVRAGMKPEEARRQALIKLGGVESAKESYRDRRGIPMLETLWQDIRFGLRMLCKSPGFTTVAVITLALGIGANTSIFSLVNAILLRSLPVPNPQELRELKWSGSEMHIRLMTGEGADDGSGRFTLDSFSYPVFSNLREESRGIADVFGSYRLDKVNLRARHEAFMGKGLMVSDNFFSALGVRPLLGRVLGPEDERAGAAPVAMISYRLWERQFDLDPGVLGQPIILNGTIFTVAGVMPREFTGVRSGEEMDLCVSMTAQPQLAATWSRTAPDLWWVALMARKKPGVSDAQLQAALDVAFAHGTETIVKQPKVLMTDGRAGTNSNRNYYRKPLSLLLGVVGMVLLVACANLAGLSLARGAARQHEFAVRAAIGAGRWRLIRQSLTESVLVALIGGGLGVVLALWGGTAVSRLLAGSAEGLHYDISLDLKVLGFTLATALVTALLSGLLPALRAASANPVSGLKGRAALGVPPLRVSRLLVAAQIAISMLLLAGAGLYARTLVNLVHINPGFTMESLLLFRLAPGAAGYRGAENTAFFDRVQMSLGAIPGVRSVAITQYALLGGWMSGGTFFTLPAHPFKEGPAPQAHRLTVSETFFATMGIPMLLGREFRAADTDGASRVVVVNETFARKYLPGEDPIGQTLNVNGADWQIVGVCRDLKYEDIRIDVPPTVYFSFRQAPVDSGFFALRTALPPISMVTAARRAVAAIDPNIPLDEISTQAQVRDQKIAQEWTFAVLCSALALLAVLLSCIGLYGLMVYNVARRTREIGIRMALGATLRQIVAPILREALLLSAAGVAISVPLTLALTRLIRSNLYGVEPSDPITLAGAAALLLGVALMAAWLPARRAAKVDPMVALRYE